MIRIIYTDGSCEPNPGIGTWAYCEIKDNKIIKYNSGVEGIRSTNNRAEYKAAIEALKNTLENESIIVFTDSELLVNTANTWMYNWETKGWKRRLKGPLKKTEVKNLDLVKQLYNLCIKRDVEFRWVRGHNGNEHNEFCDVLANEKRIEFLNCKL